MNSDAFFAIGSTHEVCQDYARSGVIGHGQNTASSRCFALLSDGCSSSAHSDLGARFLTCAAMAQLKSGTTHFSVDLALRDAAEVAQRLGIDDLECLDATLLAAWEDTNGFVSVLVAGDGVVAARRHDGAIESWTIDYDGAPAYPSYQRNQGRKALYFEQGYGRRTVTHALDKKATSLGSIGEIAPWSIALNPAIYDLVVLFSDGLASFREAKSEEKAKITQREVLEHLLALKSFKGQFLIRRCRRFLHRFCSEKKWEHHDDFSAAGIWIGARP